MNHGRDEIFDVALSFAGEHRDYVEKVALVLRQHDVRVFYDEFEEVFLWGKNMGDTLDKVFRLSSRFVVIFISDYYTKKFWCNHERQSAFARAKREQGEFILPARFDDAELAGFNPDTSYIDLRKKTAPKFAELILKKIGTTVRQLDAKTSSRSVAEGHPDDYLLCRKILVHVYKVRDAIDRFRSPWMTSEEYSQRPKGENEDKRATGNLNSYYAYQGRFNRIVDTIDELYPLQLEAEAVYGVSAKEILNELRRVVSSLRAAMETYHQAKSAGSNDSDFLKRLYNILVGTSPKDNPGFPEDYTNDDGFKEKYDKALATAEAFFRGRMLTAIHSERGITIRSEYLVKSK